MMPAEEWWIKTTCPQCQNVNWYCLGDIGDLTVCDTEALQCWSCGHAWWRDDDLFDFDTSKEIDDYAEKCSDKPR